ncbi:MAG: AAA family ATPase, partial [Planctomycetes bacterium]|nr:AAA family ATPase [Planctomycetota bacterium]
DEIMRFSTRYNEAIEVQNDLDRFRNQLRDIKDQLDAFDTEKNAPGAISLAAEAREPIEPSNKYRYAVLAGFLFMALTLSLGAPIALDYINPWVMQPNDVQAILHFPALGWLLNREDEKTKSFARDQIRRLALTINEKRLQEKRRSIVITSVKPGGGTSELSLELANEMNVIGVNTVLIEANAFHPDSRYASMDTPGLVEVLNGEKTIEEVILPGVGNLPDRIPIGNTNDRRHLPERGLMQNVITDLQKKYDLCLLDSPPILLSADAESLTRLGDATIMVVEAEGITLNEMARAAATLERLSPSAMAVVVNQVRVYTGGYYAAVLKEYLAGAKAPPRGILAKTMLRGGGKKKKSV